MTRIGRPPSCECGECEKCKHAAYMRAWYQSKSLDERRLMVAKRDQDAVRRNERKRWGTKKRRASLNAAGERARRKNRSSGRERAYRAVQYAVMTGKLVKQPCEVCGTWLVHAHHHLGYEPEHFLDVQWLCVVHHKAVHGHLRAA